MADCMTLARWGLSQLSHAVMKKTYNNPPIGCYFDGATGQQYNDIRVLKLAIGYGWDDADAIKMVEADELSQDQQDMLTDVVNDAESYLNDLETRSFLSWQWNDGDFGLYPNIEGAREDVGFISSKQQDYPPDDYAGEWLHVTDHGNATLYVRGDDGKDTEIWSVV